jgi:hypothetical protein
MVDLFRTQTPNIEINLGSSIIKATSNLKVPAKLYIVSDFLYPIEQVQKALEYATSKNFEVTLIIINTFDESLFNEDALYVDSESEKELSIEVNAKDLNLEIENHFSKIFDLTRHFGSQCIVLKHDEEIEDVFLKKFVHSSILK